MKKLYFFAFIIIVNASFVLLNAQSLNSDDVVASPSITKAVVNFEIPETGVWLAGEKSTILFDNGPLVTHPDQGSGSDTSMLQTALGMTTLGAGAQFSAGNRVAEDIVITQDCTIDSISFFAYQTGSSTTSTITGVNLQVWDGVPGDPGSNVVWGSSTTNIMGTTSFTNIYRMSDTGPGTTRPIMVAYAVTSGLVLSPGTYWFDWQYDGSLASGPWAPPVSIIGQTTTGNAKQFTASSGAWADLTDGGTLTPQGLPFVVYGEVGIVETHDVGVALLVAPVSGELTATATVTVQIENFGSENETGFDVAFQINGGTVETQTVSATVNGGATLDYTFTGTYDFSATGAITVRAWTELAADEDNTNDTLEVVINNYTQIEDISASGFVVYPNPAVYPVKVSGNENVVLVQVIDITGKVVFSDQPNKKEFYVSFHNFAEGIYNMVLTTETTVYTHKIIKP